VICDLCPHTRLNGLSLDRSIDRLRSLARCDRSISRLTAAYMLQLDGWLLLLLLCCVVLLLGDDALQLLCTHSGVLDHPAAYGIRDKNHASTQLHWPAVGIAQWRYQCRYWWQYSATGDYSWWHRCIYIIYIHSHSCEWCRTQLWGGGQVSSPGLTKLSQDLPFSFGAAFGI